MGIIDYKSIIVIIIYLICTLKVLNFFNINNEIKIYIILFSLIPIIAILSLNCEGESSIYVLCIIFKYIISNKIFILYNDKPKLKIYKYKYYINFKDKIIK